MGRESFADNPYAVRWHPTKNGLLLPEDFTCGSEKMCTFLCDVCHHEYTVTIAAATKNGGCYYCSSRKRCSPETIRNCRFCWETSFAFHEKASYWNYELNSCTPEEVSISSTGKYHFTCNKCNHVFEKKLSAVVHANSWCPYCYNRRRCPPDKIRSCKECFSKCFASHPRAMFWNYEKNDKKPEEVALHISTQFWFTCTCGHDFKTTLHDDTWCPYCANSRKCPSSIIESCSMCYAKTFAAHEKSTRWHPIKNGNVLPKDVSVGNTNKFWFICPECEHDYECRLSEVVRSPTCPFCANYQRCSVDTIKSCQRCFTKSFASCDKSKFWNYERNPCKPEEVSLKNGQKFWFTCKVCKHDFNSRLASIADDRWCPYCVNKKRCPNEYIHDCSFCLSKTFAASHKAIYWDYEKNSCKPEDVALSQNRKYWFTCENGHAFNSSLCSISGGTWCPKCMFKTEQLVIGWLEDWYGKDAVKSQATFEFFRSEHGRNFKFDFIIESMKYVIEVDGDHHFKQVWNWASPEENRKTDVLKMKYVIKLGYTVIRIFQRDIWKEPQVWKERLKTFLSNPTFKNDNVAYLSNDPTLYDKHRQAMRGSVDNMSIE
jgi:very-short-patch-repair endonuclease